MEQILKKADELGQMLLNNERYQMLRKAREAVRSNEQARQALENYQQQVDKVQQLASQQQPIEAEDKQKLAELEQQVSSHEEIRELVRTQADFSEMLNRVNRQIFGPLAADEGQDIGQDEEEESGQ